MSKSEVIASMSEKSGLSKKDSEKSLNAFIDVVTEALVKGDKVQLVGFLTMETADRAARAGRNPQTGESMQIAASKAVKVSVGKKLKDAVNGK